MRVRTWVLTMTVTTWLTMCAWPAISLADRDVGIWFSTWYYQHRVTLWSTGHGTGSSNQLIGDINGDGKDDSIAYFGASGSWYGALSNGTDFDSASLWKSGHGVGSDKQFLADVNGDGKDDAIVLFKGSGSWYVALSNGSGFNAYSQWVSGHGVGTANQLMGDVNGDGRADAVVYNNGNWYVSASNGSGFGPGYSQWTSGHGIGSTSQLLGDVNGDGRADAVVFFRDGGLGGNWYVAPSSGFGFGPGASQWTSGHGIGSDYQWLTDANGDGRDDAVIAFRNSATLAGEWYLKASTGSSFGPGASQWKTKFGADSSRMDVSDLDGDGSADAVAYWGGSGTWRAVPAGYTDHSKMSLWNEWDVRYRPIVNGKARQYDSGDPTVIEYQLRQIDDADIDFILFDLTNYLKEPELSNAKTVCHVAKTLNETESRDIEVAVAIGGIQFKVGNPPAYPAAMPETEASLVKQHFLDDPDCGPATYHHVGGKPLLISHSGGYDQRQLWESYSDHSETDDFTLRFSQGMLPNHPTNPNPSYPSRNPNGGCGTPPAGPLPPANDWGLYAGWGMPWGTMLGGSGGTAAVMPGWNNHNGGQFVSRTQYGSAAGFYLNCGWNRILSASPKPSLVVISSYNEYAEQTAVAPAHTDLVASDTESWPSTNYYWDLTVQKVAQYKSAP